MVTSDYVQRVWLHCCLLSFCLVAALAAGAAKLAAAAVVDVAIWPACVAAV